MPFSGSAIAALTVGLCSGPVTLLIARFGLMPDFGYGAFMMGQFLAVILGLIAFINCAIIHVRLGEPQNGRGRSLALVGMLASIGWAVTIIVLMQYISDHIN